MDFISGKKRVGWKMRVTVFLELFKTSEYFFYSFFKDFIKACIKKMTFSADLHCKIH